MYLLTKSTLVCCHLNALVLADAVLSHTCRNPPGVCHACPVAIETALPIWFGLTQPSGTVVCILVFVLVGVWNRLRSYESVG